MRANQDGDASSSQGHERRAYARHPLTVHARITGARDAAARYAVENVSGNGVAVVGTVNARPGEHVHVAIDYVGSGTAQVVRKAAEHTAFQFLEGESTLRQRRVEWHAGDNTDRRRHRRVRPQPKSGTRIVAPVVWPDGTQREVDVLDISAGGMQLAYLPACEGGHVTVAGVPSTVVRVTAETTAVMFSGDRDVRNLDVFARPNQAE
mgnify:CR=1 FL=1